MQVGVTEVILAVNYQPQVMMRTLESMERQVSEKYSVLLSAQVTLKSFLKYNIKITCSHETEPLGTAGPLALARDFLDDGDPFFVLNSDVICEYPLKNLLDFHNGHEGEGTIMVGDNIAIVQLT
jgi:mannose-1-phosphate guanylyltransferase